MASGKPGRFDHWKGPRRRVRDGALLIVLVVLVAACSKGKSTAPTTTLAVTDSSVDTTALTTTTTTLALPTTTTTVAATTTTVATPIVPGTKYTVQAGDTLKSIATRAGETVAQLVGANNITDPNHIIVGQLLTIPKRTYVAPSTTVKGTATTVAGTGKTYTVVAGDSLGSIAAKYGVTVSALQTLNNITDPNTIYVGQVLKIP